MKRGATSTKVERRTVEKNRRILMKMLCFKLVSLIPNNYLARPKESLSQQDQIDHSAEYIKKLSERVEELRSRKAQLMIMKYGTNNVNAAAHKMAESKQQPIVRVKELGSGVEVVLISGLTKKIMISEVITIIEQEAAQVLTLSTSTIHDKIIHTIHAQVKILRVGVDAERISERIEELISSSIY